MALQTWGRGAATRRVVVLRTHLIGRGVGRASKQVGVEAGGHVDRHGVGGRGAGVHVEALRAGDQVALQHDPGDGGTVEPSSFADLGRHLDVPTWRLKLARVTDATALKLILGTMARTKPGTFEDSSMRSLLAPLRILAASVGSGTEDCERRRLWSGS